MTRSAAVVVLVCLCASAHAQWNAVLPNLIYLAPNTEEAALSYRSGQLWAGCFSLYHSSDSGASWQRNLGFPLDSAGLKDHVMDIDIFDSNTILITCSLSLYLSTNAGTTWKRLLDESQINGGISGCFCGSPNQLAVIDISGNVYLSKNSGASWNIKNLNTVAQKIAYHNGAIYAVTGNGDAPNIPFTGGTIFKSTDLGTSWQALPGVLDQDSYTFSFDSCLGAMYATNEAHSNLADTVSQVVRSTDGGSTWQTSVMDVPEFYAGALGVGKQCLFATTTTGGVMRMTAGQWQKIGGPVCLLDERSIAALDDEIVFVLDASGSIIRTMNSGGIPIPGGYAPPSISAYSLFATDTASSCFARTASVVITPYTGTTCFPPNITSQPITGADAAAFTLIHSADASLTSLDSDIVLFEPNGPTRDYHALLTITLSDGTIWHVTLAGHGLDSSHVKIEPSNSSIDTIGEVWIAVHGSSIPNAIDARLTYDTSSLILLSAIDANHNSIVHDSTEGAAHLHWNPTVALAADSAIAYLHFEFYPQQQCSWYSIDSIHFTGDTSLCASLDTVVPSTLCLSGPLCGAPIEAGLMRYGSVPLVRIAPNPASSFAALSCNRLISNATISIFDAAGVLRSSETTDISNSTSLDLSGLPSGVYFIRITAPGLLRNFRILHF